jgi:hypothetical protein
MYKMGNFLRRESVCSRCLFITNTQEQTKSTTFMYMTIKLFESTHKFNAHLYEEKTVNDNTYICTRLVTSATLSSTKRCEVWSGIKNITCLRPYHICFFWNKGSHKNSGERIVVRDYGNDCQNNEHITH